MKKAGYLIDLLKRNRRMSVITGSLMLFVILFVMLLVSWYSGSLNEQFYNERSDKLMTVTKKCSECMDETILNGWRETYIAENFVNCVRDDLMRITGGDRSAATLAKSIQRCVYDTSGSDASDTVILVDSDLKLFDGEGNTARWPEADELRNGLSENGTNICISTLPYQSREESSIFLIKKLDEPAQTDGSPITHILTAVSAQNLSDCFRVDEYGGRSFVYVVGSDGGRLCRYCQGDEFIDMFNVFKALDEGTYIEGDTIDDIRKSFRFAERGTKCISFAYSGSDHYAATSSLESGDWYLVMFVPTEVLAKDAKTFSRRTATFFVMLLLIIAGAVALVIFNVMKLRSQQLLNEQQQDANALLAEEAKRAEEASAAKSMFLSNMSHDIRTPINGIVGMTAIAKKERDIPPKVLECLNKIEGSSQHLLSLINDVLDMSRIESGKIVIAQDPVDIRTVATNCDSIVRGQLENRAINFVTEFADITHPYLLGDELKIRQVLINILGNAIKFTPDGGTIWFRMSEIAEDEASATIRFEVEDTGIGMKKEFLSRIWDSFSQAEGGARSKYKGTGLGMAITKQFVELMHGDIRVESELNVGSRFTVELPLYIDFSEHEEQNDENIGANIKGARIMLVEDNELNMEIATELLEDEGLVIIPAENGLIALNKFMNDPPGTYDMILMDIMMPEMDGLEATRAIRALDRPDAATIPIAAMSANAFEEDIRKSKEAGMNAHLSKPIDLAETLMTISNYIAKRSNEE